MTIGDKQISHTDDSEEFNRTIIIAQNKEDKDDECLRTVSKEQVKIQLAASTKIYSKKSFFEKFYFQIKLLLWFD